jgi:hypothetical protein
MGDTPKWPLILFNRKKDFHGKHDEKPMDFGSCIDQRGHETKRPLGKAELWHDQIAVAWNA